MKKLYSLLAAAFVAVSLMAQEPTMTFVMANYDFPADYINVQTTYGTGDTAITMVPGTSGSGWKMQGSALIYGKNNAELQFTVPFSVGKIIVHGPASGASGKVTFNVFDLSCAELIDVSEVATGANGDHTFLIDINHRLPGTTYAIRNTNDNNNQIVSIDLYETSEGTPEPPIFGLAGGTYTESQMFGITCATAGATIYYTTDGTDPTEASNPFEGQIIITSTTTVKAVAILNGVSSTITEATYVIYNAEGAGTREDPFTIADVVALNSPAAYKTQPVWVEGSIVGFYKNSKPVPGVEGAEASNIAIATDGDTIPVQLPNGAERTALNLVDNPGNLNAMVKVYGTLEVYFGFNGVKNVSNHEISTTAIKNVAAEQKAVKVIENGQIVFIKNGVKFNALGARL